MNVCTFVGRLGRDAETKTVNETTVTSFSLASNTGYGDNKSTIWVDCSVWGVRGEKIAEYLKKGTSATVIGNLSQRSYTNKDGEDKTALDMRVQEIDFSNPRESEGGNSNEPINDDIPF
jgi:single-strand DNA-binding protein